VVVELKARFDEAANIRWSSRMEEAGIHVTYGVMDLKTHCKVIMVVRNDYSGLRRYVHIGTGNYHAGNARLYTDLGLITSDQDIGRDITELFNYLTTGYLPKRVYGKLLPAPKHLKPGILAKITNSISAAGINITGVKVSTDEGDKATQSFELVVSNVKTLEAVMKQISRVKGVQTVERTKA